MLTRPLLRYKGSLESVVIKTPSMPKAAAERKMAPTFVGLTTLSKTPTLACLGKAAANSTRLGRFFLLKDGTPQQIIAWQLAQKLRLGDKDRESRQVIVVSSQLPVKVC